MIDKEHVNFLYEKGYKDIEDTNIEEFNFIYNFEKQNETEIITPVPISYNPIIWYGEKHYEIIMKLFTDLEFVRMENVNNSYSENINPIII